MAFKMTPGIKGNSSMNRIKNLGACGGPGQPPCEPRFQKEVEEAKVQDRKSNRFVKAKAKAAVVAPPPPPPRQKLQINLPKGYEFRSPIEEKMFYMMFEQALEKGKWKTQEELDRAIFERLMGGGPKDPKDPGGPVIGGPVIGGPILDWDEENPRLEVPIKAEPIKGGGEFEAVPVKGVNAVKGK